MLELVVKPKELWDEANSVFVTPYERDYILKLEHSLISISKWEAKWHKAFLTKQEKTYEETIDYIKCMTINTNVDPYIYYCLTQEQFNEINAYIENPMSATNFFYGQQGGGSRDTVTNELIYYWMASYNIPFSCDKWHLNHLLKLIEVCNRKNTPPNKRKLSTRDVMRQNAALNAQRRKKFNTKG